MNVSLKGSDERDKKRKGRGVCVKIKRRKRVERGTTYGDKKMERRERRYTGKWRRRINR